MNLKLYDEERNNMGWIRMDLKKPFQNLKPIIASYYVYNN